MPSSPNRKRGRIGLTLAPDVMDILNENGHCTYEYDPAAIADGTLRCKNCDKALMDGIHNKERPTRTEIIEVAVREWDANQRPTRK